MTAFVTAIGPSHFPLRPFWGPSARALLLRTFLPITVAIVAVTGILAHIGGQWNPALASASAVLFASVLVAMVVSRLAARIGGGLDDARLKIQVLNTELARQIEERTRQLVATQHAEARAEQQVRRLAALRMIDLAIAASMDLRITLHVVVDQVVAQLHADAVAVLLLNPHTYVLDYAAGHGFHATAIEHVQFRLGEGLAGRVAQEERLVAVPDLVSHQEHVARAAALAAEGLVAYHAAPLISKGVVRGVLEVFHRAPFNPDDEWVRFLEALAGQAAIAVDNGMLFEDLQRSHTDLVLAYDSTIEGWSRALDLRDRETEGHSQRVTAMAVRLARALGVPDAELAHIRRGALLHDIGKMGIPDYILRKRSALTDDERETMQRHAVYAYELLSPIAHLRAALEIPYCHHERWDGTGYPRGLAGEQIPLAARIFAVVDVWDALRSHRPYRDAWGKDQALAHIREQSGSHFDPRVVEAFLGIIDALEAMSPDVRTRPGIA